MERLDLTRPDHLWIVSQLCFMFAWCFALLAIAIVCRFGRSQAANNRAVLDHVLGRRGRRRQVVVTGLLVVGLASLAYFGFQLRSEERGMQDRCDARCVSQGHLRGAFAVPEDGSTRSHVCRCYDDRATP